MKIACLTMKIRGSAIFRIYQLLTVQHAVMAFCFLVCGSSLATTGPWTTTTRLVGGLFPWTSTSKSRTNLRSDKIGNMEPPKPPKPEEWDPAQARKLLDEFNALLTDEHGNMTLIGEAIKDSIAEVCDPVLTPPDNRHKFWLQYRDGEPGMTMQSFFEKWLVYAPVPANETITDINEPNSPGFYIAYWDYLANTESGLWLTNESEEFKSWFIKFLDLHGVYINSVESDTSIPLWMAYHGDEQHPCHISDFVVPSGGFKTFNQFFLRMAKSRPLSKEDKMDERAIVSPSDGGVFYLSQSNTPNASYELPGKSKDRFNVKDAFPGYGARFVGGPLLDSLLWFTDFHHFFSPVSGTVLHIGEYKGSYNYDFDDFDPDDPYAPPPPPTSDRVGWYDKLNKHRRTVWIIRTKEIGLVAMAAIGFWGVGSIVSFVKEGDELVKGEYMGHFGYGGSSIVLAMEPDIDFQFIVNGTALSGPESPRLVLANQHLGRANEQEW